ERALRGHAVAREERVAERAADRARGRGLARRQPQHERRHAAPECRDEPRDKTRDERHVQAGDAHEVRYARAVEELPLLSRDGALVAYRERGEDAGGGRRAEHRVEAIAHRFTRALDEIEERVALAEAPWLGPRANIARRADAALEEPGLVVEAVRIHEAVGSPQAHGECPTLAGM